MISNLQELVTPLSETEFLEILRNRALTFRRGAGRNRFASLLNWDMLEGLIAGGSYPSSRISVRGQSFRIPEIVYSTNGKVVPERIFRLVSKGMSLVLLPLDEYVPALASLCENISRSTSERVWSGAIASTGSGGAFRLHFDAEDLLILQVEGLKRWIVYGPPVRNPVRAMEGAAPSTSELIFDEILSPGDLLFLPAGYWHHCDNGSARSLHVGIFIEPMSALDVLQELRGRLLSEESLRQPLTRQNQEPAVVEAALKALLIEQIEQLSLAAAVERHRVRPGKYKLTSANK